MVIMLVLLKDFLNILNYSLARKIEKVVIQLYTMHVAIITELML